ncbi:MAG: 2-isopropylmalate synthase [Spirochaetales bacterium]|nr:2-isopropylmalate synthase [Spirochaetales bacterium]MCF7939235.1 2-isopropylmalate synthase [Spirochaetales bacterium]
MDHVAIFDTTLRDGEQSPGASMDIEQKLEIAHQLARLGVDAIEAGFPVSSPHQFDACRQIAEQVQGPVITGLARTVEKDIDIVRDALSKAEHWRIHTFIATSPIHMKHKLNMEADAVLEKAVKAVSYARGIAPEVEFSPEDGTRTELDFLCRITEAVIDAGATVVNIPDTVGYSVPEEMAEFISTLKNRVPNIDKAILSVHCHNDLGLAVANTLAAVEKGARQVEVTINGIGERAGNAALEEVVMTLNTRKERLGLTTGVNTKQLYNSSLLLSSIVGFPIPRNKPIVGDNAFAHESGIHQDGVIKNRQTYEIMTPESVGKEESSIVLGRHSGKHGFTNRLKELGISLNKEETDTAYQRFLELADRKKEVYDEDLFIIIGQELHNGLGTYKLNYFNVISGNVSVPTATVRIEINDECIEEAATGDGPIDALFNAIDRATKVKTRLARFQVQAVTPGKQALGEVSVSLEIEENISVGRGSSTDIIEASGKAYVHALNKHLMMKQATEAHRPR